MRAKGMRENQDKSTQGERAYMLRELKDILKDLGKFKFVGTNNNEAFKIANSVKYIGDYTGKSIKRTKLTDCTFCTATFDSAAITGSFFQKCTFSQCSMNKADIEFCNFEDCDFLNNPFQDISFNNSTFYNTKFIKSSFSSCTLTGVQFKSVHLSDLDIIHSTLEGAIFESCTFQNMDLSKLNMEYAELKDVSMENVILPFSQIPYVFGGVEYIKGATSNIRITTGEDCYITPQIYFDEAIKLLCEYYEVQECHFPLANIYLALKDNINAYKHLQLGMQQCVIMKDFRMLKYFCKLAAQSDTFTYKQLHSMYTLIQKYFPQDKLNKQQLHNYSKHIGEIKTLLFSKHNLPRMTFAIKTDIEPDHFQELSVFLADIFYFKEKICSEKHSTQLILTQNSPFIVTLDVTDELPNLCLISLILIKLINESNVLYEKYLDFMNACNQISSNFLIVDIRPLIELAEDKKNNYDQMNSKFLLEEILFYNIDTSTNITVPYFNSNYRQMIGE